MPTSGQNRMCVSGKSCNVSQITGQGLQSKNCIYRDLC
jgi:hypothetical protein